MTPVQAPYGSWKSPVTSDLIVQSSIGLSGLTVDGEDLYWLEMRPNEGGRYALVRRTPDGEREDVMTAPWNARTRVHEYGGGSYIVHKGIAYFTHFPDQRLYRKEPGKQPVAISPERDWRYADFAMDERHNRLICVREDHANGQQYPDNTIVAIDLETQEQTTLVSGADFYMAPRLSPDGTTLAWISWVHPNMPWDDSSLSMAAVRDDGTLGEVRHIAGGKDESVCLPAWSPDNTLYFVSDRTDWWNLYRFADGKVEQVTNLQAEFGLPAWGFDDTTYDFLDAHTMLCAYTQKGVWRIASLDLRSKELQSIETDYDHFDYVTVLDGNVATIAGSPTQPRSVVLVDPVSGRTDVLKKALSIAIDDAYLSIPRAIEFPTTGGRTAHAFYYAPHNGDFNAADTEKPPLLVLSHGGPTGATSNVFSAGIQYWTSRGFAVVDVNYGGSTGYGRKYRQRLNDNWGVVDVDDCVNAALHLVKSGLADEKRLAIRGGSAGGYTTLCALTFKDVFRAGASHFGISDMEGLLLETHKFESLYTINLVGPYPERKDIYVARSPLHHAEKLTAPTIFFQGLEDKIVLPNQAEKMVDALRAKGVPVSYVAYAGEQHGFRKAENIKHSLDSELYFYSRVFGFELADKVEPVDIENLD